MQKVIRCRNCNDGEMITSYTTKFNGWGLVWAVISLWVCFGLIFIPVYVAIFIPNDSYKWVPILAWCVFWLCVFCVNCANMKKRMPTWRCKNCDYSYLKNSA